MSLPRGNKDTAVLADTDEAPMTPRYLWESPVLGSYEEIVREWANTLALHRGWEIEPALRAEIVLLLRNTKTDKKT